MTPQNTVAQFYRSTEEALVFRYTFENRSFTGRTLRINVRDRDTNTIKKTLNAPTNLTITSSGVSGHPADNDIAAQVSLADMSLWSVGEYEVDLLDVTNAGSPTRLVAGRVTMHEPGKLVYGVVGNQVTIRVEANQAVITAVGGVGIPGPATNVTIGVVDTLPPGSDATAGMTGEPPDLVLGLGIPQGDTGDTGDKAWSPVYAIAADGTRRVLRLESWVGGEGAAPPTTSGGNPLYVGPAGLTTTIGDASDVRGVIGLTGNKGWSPILAMVPDSARRVLQVQSWTGGEGTPPASGSYLGPAGFVAAIGDATDFRGEPGASVGPGSIGTEELADEAVTEEKIDPDYRATLATQDDLDGFTPRTDPTGSSAIPAGTTGQRDGSPAAGYIRFNLTTGEYEGYNGTAWVPIGGGGALVADTPPTANLREGLLWFSRSWGALFVYYVDANGGHWVSTTPVIDPSAFVLKSTAQADLAFSAYMWGLRTAVDAAAARAALVVPWELIEQKSPTLGQTEIDFTSFPAGFDRFAMEIDGIGVVTDDTTIYLRVQTGGSTWQVTGYGFGGRIAGPGGSADMGSSIDSYSLSIPLNRFGAGNAIGNAVGKGLSSKVSFNPKDTNSSRKFRIESDWTRSDGLHIGAWIMGVYGSNTAITGVRIMPGTGGLKGQGNVKLLGLRA